MMNAKIGRIGVWSMAMRFGDPAEGVEGVKELEALGYGALWLPGGIGGDLTGDIDRFLSASSRIGVASGILNIWKHEARDVAAWWKGLRSEHKARLLLGLGVSHVQLIGDDYAKAKPLGVMRDYLDKLTDAGVPAEALLLAALGPKMLELGRDRTAGVHPYLVTPEHTKEARNALGPGKIVAPEQGVILETDPAEARRLAREALAPYQAMTNYRNSWLRLGFTTEEIDGASDRLIDALFAWGSPERIRERVEAHFAAGANHVCLQVITGAGLDVAAERAVWRRLAPVLL